MADEDIRSMELTQADMDECTGDLAQVFAMYRPRSAADDGSRKKTRGRKSRNAPTIVQGTSRRKRVKLSTEDLTGDKGLIALVANFKAFNTFTNKPGMEGTNLNNVLQRFKAWTEQCCPGLSLADFLAQNAKLGNSEGVRQVSASLFNEPEGPSIVNVLDGSDVPVVEAEIMPPPEVTVPMVTAS